MWCSRQVSELKPFREKEVMELIGRCEESCELLADEQDKAGIILVLSALDMLVRLYTEKVP